MQSQFGSQFLNPIKDQQTISGSASHSNLLNSLQKQLGTPTLPNQASSSALTPQGAATHDIGSTSVTPYLKPAGVPESFAADKAMPQIKMPSNLNHGQNPP